MKEKRLILALDVTERERAITISESIREQVFAIKVNWPLVMSAGIEIVREISAKSRVICDFKIADVPNTVRLITERARENGAYGIITHSFTGHDSLAEAVKTAGPMKVFSVVAMSNEGSRDFVDPVMDSLVSASLSAGVSGFIAPGNRYETLSRIRSMVGKATILAPGIGKQGGSAAEAIRSGADYVIVGRSIYEAQDPSDAANRINASIDAV